jgi:subtilisin family serine protease
MRHQCPDTRMLRPRHAADITNHCHSELNRAEEQNSLRVGVIDSGWDRSIKERKVTSGIALSPRDDVHGSPVPSDDHDNNGHGTSCADLILQVAPFVTIVPIRVFDRVLETSPIALIRAIEWALDQDIRLINMSLGTARRDALIPLYAACEKARRRGAVLVAAGGRSAAHSFPANFDPVIGVSAGVVSGRHGIVHRPEDALECVAQGYRQRARGLGGLNREVSGTSFAAPIVTGHVARLLKNDPQLTIDGVRKIWSEKAI